MGYGWVRTAMVVLTLLGCRQEVAEEPRLSSSTTEESRPSPGEGRVVPCTSADFPTEVLIAEATRLGLLERPEVAGRLRAFREKLLVQTLLEEQVYSALKVTDEEVRRYFEQHSGDYRRGQQIRVHHLRVQDEPADALSGKTALQRARELAGRLRSMRGPGHGRGKGPGPGMLPFGLADGPGRGAREDQGLRDLGFFSRGRFDEELDEVLFSLDPGAPVAVVERDDGVHVFKLMATRPEHRPSFAEVEQRVREDLLRQRRQEALDRYLETLAARPHEDGGR